MPPTVSRCILEIIELATVNVPLLNMRRPTRSRLLRSIPAGNRHPTQTHVEIAAMEKNPAGVIA